MENFRWLTELLGDSSFSLDLGGGLGIVSYVLTAWALYTIAKRRGLSSPWMAWVPLVNVWTLGAVSDQYRLVTKGEKKNKRKWLLGLSIAMCALVMAVLVWACVLIAIGFNSVPSAPDSVEEIVEGLLPEIAGGLLAGIPIFLALMGVAIASAVLTWMAIWDIFKSCDVGNAQKYFLISILTSLVGIAGFDGAFLFAVKDCDAGMTPLPPEEETV